MRWDASGQVQVINGIMFDVSERKAAEASLHDSMEHQRESAETIRILTETGRTALSLSTTTDDSRGEPRHGGDVRV